MEKKTTLSIYRSHNDAFEPKEFTELASEFSKITGKSISITQVITDDGEEILFTFN